MKALRSVLLIDDDEADNFFHRRAIEAVGGVEEVVVMEDPTEALAGLRDGNLTPDLIFLDINMPVMNGWEFLAEFERFSAERKHPTVVIMLSTAPDPLDRDQAHRLRMVSGFRDKPLTPENFRAIVAEHFEPAAQ